MATIDTQPTNLHPRIPYHLAMAGSRSTRLAGALRSKHLVRFTRPFEDGSVNGYVLAIGPRWFLVSLVGDGIRFDGFQCFRLSDVRKVYIPHPHTAFIE